MSKLNTIALAACAWALTAMPANAADLVPFEPIPVPVPIPPAIVGGWYLRGDIGYSNQNVDELDNVLYDTTDSIDEVSRDFDGAPIFGAGIGYKFNRWFRADVTGEYRSKADFTGADIIESGGVTTVNTYDAKKSEWLGLVNAYADLGSWRGISPYVGAGVGAVNVEIHGFSDIGVGSSGDPAFAFGEDNDEWNFAWAVYAGVGFEVTPSVTLDIGYRYLDLGDAESGDLVTYDGVNNVDNPMEFKDIASHDIRLGVRYLFR